jgi:hypothetical protein
MEIKATERLKATANTQVLALLNKKALARSLFYEMEKYLKGSQFNNLDASIRFTCELKPVETTLRHLGFKDRGDGEFHRPDMVVHVKEHREGWHPVLRVL